MHPEMPQKLFQLFLKFECNGNTQTFTRGPFHDDVLTHNRLNHLGEPVSMTVPKPMPTEFGIHYELESCVTHVDWALETSPFDMIRRVTGS